MMINYDKIEQMKNDFDRLLVINKISRMNEGQAGTPTFANKSQIIDYSA